MTASSGFHRGQVGALIRLETEDDAALLAAATVRQIHYRQPGTGVVGVWTASLDGTKLTYLTTAITDLPYAGDYLLQAYIEGSAGKLHGEIVTMTVGDTVKPLT